MFMMFGIGMAELVIILAILMFVALVAAVGVFVLIKIAKSN